MPSLEEITGVAAGEGEAKPSTELEPSKRVKISAEDLAASVTPVKEESSVNPLIDAWKNSSVNRFVEDEIISPIGKLVSSVLPLEQEEGDKSKKPATALKQFVSQAELTANNAAERVGTSLAEGNIDKPITGAVKAIIGGGADLLETANTGINFLFNMATGQGPRAAFKSAKELETSGPQVKDIVEKIAKVNLAPENEVEQSMQELLGLIPGSVFAAGEDVYQRTGSVMLAAGVESVGTLLTLKPGIAGKVLKATPLAIEGLAVKSFKAAKQLAEHVKEDNSGLAKELDAKIAKTEKLTPEAAETLGEKIVQSGFKKVGETAEGKPRVRVEEKSTKPKTAEEQIKINEDKIKQLEEQLKQKVVEDTIDQGKIEQGLTTVASEVTETTRELVKPVTEESLTKSKSNPILSAIEQLNPQSKGGALVYIDQLRDKVKDQFKTKEEFDQALKNLEKSGDVQMQANAWPGRLTEEDKAKLVPGERLDRTGSKKEPVWFDAIGLRLEKGEEQVTDPVLYRDDTGEAVTESQAKSNFTIYQSSIPVPGADFVVGKLKGYFNEIQRLVALETLGPGAKTSAAMTAKNIAGQMRSDVFYTEKSKGRRSFWENNTAEVAEFIKQFETGKPQKNALFQAAADAYSKWNEQIYAKEKSLGIKYDPVDNYLYHVFEDSSGVAQFFERKYGPRWNEPGFVKDRAFKMYEIAEAAGFKPKYRNPEDIMLARQHASSVAEMRIQTLNDLKDYGLAQEITKGNSDPPVDWNAVKWKSPNGTKYWVHEHAAQILHNAFETRSLWSVNGILGDTFRGAMFLKNIMVSTLLSLSGFHGLHVLTIDNATSMVRASKEALSGKQTPLTWMKNFIEANLYGSKGIPLKALYDNPAFGGRLIKAYEGKIEHSQLSTAEQQLMGYMTEGGFIPHLSAQYKATAIENFKKAIREQSPAGYAKATLWSPFAVLQAFQKPMMEIWIPRLKAASYAKDIQSALKVDPGLLQDSQKRIEAFHKLAKSVDNRYGEMAYNTLFWNKTVKDLGVANTLSLGWQLGFIREYGGGLMDVGQFAKGGSTIPQKIKSGLLDRPMFVAFYTGQSLLYGGLMTYLLTGNQPEKLEDYIFPKNGEKNPDGTDQRVSTMYYVKEFASVAKRIEIDGVAGGVSHVVQSKASGVIGAVGEWVTGLNSMGQEIRDPNAPAYQQLQQALGYSLQRMEPISMKAVRENNRSLKSAVMSVAGFSPAPRYITESVVEGKIKSAYQKYNTGKQLAYEKFLLSNERKELQRLYEAGEMDKYDEKLDQVVDKFKLTPKEQVKLTKAIGNKDFSEGFLNMFKSLPWQRQKLLLDQMTEEERDVYLPVANKDHLRFDYEPPQEEE